VEILEKIGNLSQALLEIEKANKIAVDNNIKEMEIKC